MCRHSSNKCLTSSRKNGRRGLSLPCRPAEGAGFHLSGPLRAFFANQRKAMTMTEVKPADTAERKVLRVIEAYAVEWHYAYPSGLYGNDVDNLFRFLPGAFDRAIARKANIQLTQDLTGMPIFAQTSDGTLQITSDATGLLVRAELVDTAQNRRLVNLIDSGAVKGWSHRFRPLWGGFRCRCESGIQYTDHRVADLSEISVVLKKVPRQKVRTTPVFLSGGPSQKDC